MHFIYVIQSLNNDGCIYIGNTSDLERRLKEHNQGVNPSTRNKAPFRLVYYEAYRDPRDAFDREYKLKHHGSVIGHLKKRLRNSLVQC